MTKKELGQHWLKSNEALLAMVDAAEVQPGDNVLEIGPGLGYLTDKLLQAGASVTALEFDQDLLPSLDKKYSNNKSLALVEGDIRTYDLSLLPTEYKISANIPYYLSANLLRRLTDDSHKPGVAALLVQKEVAQKVAAQVGKRSMLAVLVQAWYAARQDILVPAKLFEPAPKVDSMILVLDRRTASLVDVDKWPGFVRIVKVCYAMPRKKLRANLSAGLQIEKSQADQLLEQAGVDVDARAEALTDQEWLGLMGVINA